MLDRELGRWMERTDRRLEHFERLEASAKAYGKRALVLIAIWGCVAATALWPDSQVSSLAERIKPKLMWSLQSGASPGVTRSVR
jgi:hypothetical protein